MPAKNELLYNVSGYAPIKAVFTSADSTNAKAIGTANAADANLIWLSITSTDTAANDILLYLNDGSTDYLIGHIDVPALAGSDGSTPAVNGLNSTNLPFLLLDDTGSNRYLPLDGGCVLKATVRVAVTATKQITIRGAFGSYGVL